MAQIGIKLADGSFFSVMEEDDEPRRKRVVLSPARKDQNGAQIDIIRRDNDVDQYVGCLVLEDLQPGDDQDLELIIGLDGERNLNARVGDASGKQYQSLAVSLDRLEQPEHYSLPEEPATTSFDVGDIGDPEDLDDTLEMPDIAMPDLDDVELFEEEQDNSSEEDSFYNDAEAEDDASDEYEDGEYGVEDDASDEYEDGEYEEEPRPFNPVVLMAIILITLSLLALGAYGILRFLGARMLPELRAASLVFLPAIPAGLRNRTRGLLRRGA